MVQIDTKGCYWLSHYMLESIVMITRILKTRVWVNSLSSYFVCLESLKCIVLVDMTGTTNLVPYLYDRVPG